jgi:hypothetical protein
MPSRWKWTKEETLRPMNVCFKATTTQQQNQTPSPKLVTEATKQYGVTATRKTTTSMKTEGKLTLGLILLLER